MAYILSDLISEVQRRAKDNSFDSALITDYLNEIQQEVLGERMFSFLEETITATLNQNDTSYAYPSDLQTILGLRLTDPSSAATYFRPSYKPFREFDKLYPTPEEYGESVPVHYSDFGRELLWSCPLDKGYSLRLRYLKAVPELSGSTDVPVIPQEFKGILIRGALAGVEEYRDNYDIAALHRRKVEDLTEDLILRYSSRSLLKLAKSSRARLKRP